MKRLLIAALWAMSLANVSGATPVKSACDPKEEPCLIAGKDYYIHRLRSAGDVFDKEQDPNHDFRIAFWATIAKKIADKNPGDTCNFADGAKVRVVEKFKDYDGYLVKYLGGANATGACPVGSYAAVAGIPLFAFKSTKNIAEEASQILKSGKR